MIDIISIDDFIKLESEFRKNQKWFIFSGYVVNDLGQKIHVQCKSFGSYNQILIVNDINYSFGHTMEEKGVKNLKDKYKSCLNNILNSLQQQQQL